MKYASVFYILGSLFFLTLAPSLARAQKIDSMINVYGERFPQEKVHIHLDKALYNPGETIWYKAYLFSGLLPSVISHNFYTELIDPATGKVLQRKVTPIFEGTTAGNFDLPLNLTNNSLTFRAYTTWMLNFDTTFLFSKNIRIVSKSTPADKKPAENKSSLKFFPEGGDMVQELSNPVAFKAVDSYGFPVGVKGAVKNSKGAVVVNFNSLHDGMGRFDLEPQPNTTYYAEWTDDKGKSYKTDLPVARPSGAQLQMMSSDKLLSFIIKRSNNATAENQRFYLVGNMYQQVVYKATINLANNFMTSGTIPIAELPTGILEMTLFNANWQPLAERIVFINKEDYLFDASINVATKNTAKRGKNVVTVEVPDTLRSNLSISITDAVMADKGEDNIISHLLLTGDLKGYVNEPSYYFNVVDDSTRYYLDLVMMTNGWRRFKWNDLAQGKVPELKYPRDNYLSLKGEVLGMQSSQIPAGATINAFMESKDSSRQFFSMPLDSRGQFKEEGLIFFDTVKIYYQFNKDKRLTDRAVVNFSNGTYRGLPVLALDSAWRVPVPLDTSALNRSKFIAAEADRIRPELAKQVKTLEAVTVKARQKSAKEQMDEKYARGLFSGGDATTFDMVNDPFAQSATNIFQYLQGRVAGLQINMNGANGPSISWRQSATSLFLDEMPVDANMIQNIPVSDIAYVKAFRPPFFGASGGGSGGAIAIYTRKGNDAKSNSAIPGGMEKNLIPGYATMKEFYAPDHSKEAALYDVPDVRTTLYWSPYLLMDKGNRRVTITFYNNDVSKRIKVVMEGMNEEGRLTRIEKMID
ncbi:hypothetical protein [Paraflavitalea pollutisoli]|uniref:hypothetical protein n=1 Tax=Paraflavitalea pollutisoli TaxID=3034143 RepID=UPI0023EC937B|nr:hypothetical protein [Paraflavitalea sp. H1-2-19X]